jgi:hypothetical protein
MSMTKSSMPAHLLQAVFHTPGRGKIGHFGARAGFRAAPAAAWCPLPKDRNPGIAKGRLVEFSSD